MTTKSKKTARSSKLTYDQIMRTLKSNASPENVAGMARYGIKADRNYGVCTPVLFDLARRVKGDHRLALRLWNSGIRDARLVACFMDDPDLVTEEQMDDWVEDFNSWDVCDGCCLHLFRRTRFAHKKAREWTRREEEFVKRAGYVMIATLTVQDKKSPDKVWRQYFPIIVKGSTDERNYVKKAVNWALRQIGKRNLALNREAIKVAERIAKIDSKVARWIASDALRELRSDKVQEMLRRRSG
jgi:3-methyladenine DNA glycosylase AlkD